MESEYGKVVKIDNGIATIQMYAGEHCKQCSAKHICSALGSTLREIQVPAVANLIINDAVTIQYQARSKILSASLIFLLPVIMLITSYFVGFKIYGTENKAILIGMGGLILSFVVLWGFNAIIKKSSQFVPTIKSINDERGEVHGYI